MKISALRDVQALEAMPLSTHNLPANTYALLKQGAQIDPDAAALSYFKTLEHFASVQSFSHAQCLARITQAANAFRTIGITRNEVIAYMLPCVPQALFTLWGGEAAGVVMPVNPMLEAQQIAHLLRAAKARWLVTLAPQSAAETSKLRDIVTTMAGLRGLILVAEQPSEVSECQAAFPALEVLDFEQLLNSANAKQLDFPEPQAGDIASYFCTGGTTGMPKIATRTHFSEVYDVWALGAFVDFLGPHSSVFCGLPLFHVNSQLISGLLPLSKGAHIVMGTPQGFRTPGLLDRFWVLVEHFRISLFSAVPTVYSALLQRPVGSSDISSLRAVLCGAAPMPVEVFKEFQARTGVRILEGYGLTEAACASTINPLHAAPRIGSIGVRLPYQDARVVILGDDGLWVRDAELQEVGVLAIHGPNLFSGYLEAEHNAGLWIERAGERWLNTGDLARCDEDGYFWLTGRRKELIIRGGHNIDPKVIEESLHGHPAVALSAAVGRPDAYAGELPVAYVQLKPGAAVDEQTLLDFCAEMIPERAAIPKKIHVVDALPTTAVGKIFKPALVMREIESVVREEAEQASVRVNTVEVTQASGRGLLARVSVVEGVATLQKALGRYTFAHEVVASEP